MKPNQVQAYLLRLTDLARQLNSFASSLKAQRKDSTKPNRELREATIDYEITMQDDHIIFTDKELDWSQSLISNL